MTQRNAENVLVKMPNELLFKIFDHAGEESAADVQCLRYSCKHLHLVGSVYCEALPENGNAITRRDSKANVEDVYFVEDVFKPHKKLWNSDEEHLEFVKRCLRDYKRPKRFWVCTCCFGIKFKSQFPMPDLLINGCHVCGGCVFKRFLGTAKDGQLVSKTDEFGGKCMDCGDCFRCDADHGENYHIANEEIKWLAIDDDKVNVKACHMNLNGEAKAIVREYVN